MDSFSWLIAEMLIKERDREATMLARTAPERHASRGGVKHALATTFVRLGLRLDPAAGEGLGAFGAPLVRQERGC
jgi:hypothetical protein